MIVHSLVSVGVMLSTPERHIGCQPAGRRFSSDGGSIAALPPSVKSVSKCEIRIFCMRVIRSADESHTRIPMTRERDKVAFRAGASSLCDPTNAQLPFWQSALFPDCQNGRSIFVQLRCGSQSRTGRSCSGNVASWRTPLLPPPGVLVRHVPHVRCTTPVAYAVREAWS